MDPKNLLIDQISENTNEIKHIEEKYFKKQ